MFLPQETPYVDSIGMLPWCDSGALSQSSNTTLPKKAYRLAGAWSRPGH